MQGATHKHEHTRATAVLLMGGPTRRLFGAAPSSEGGERIVLEREEREKERKRKGKRKEKERKERKEKEKERKGKKRGKRKGKDHVKKKRKEEEGWSKRRKREGKRKRRKERSESAERVFRVLRQLLRRQIAVHLGHVHLRPSAGPGSRPRLGRVPSLTPSVPVVNTYPLVHR